MTDHANLSFELNHKYISRNYYRVYIFIASIFLYIFFLSLITDDRWGNNNIKISKSESTLYNAVLLFCLLLVAICISYFILKNKYDRYNLTVVDDVLKITQRRYLTFIQLSNVAYVLKTRNGALHLNQKNKPFVQIPNSLKNKEVLEQYLRSKNIVFVNGSDTFLNRYPLATYWIIIAYLLTILAITNKLIVSIFGTLLIGAIIYRGIIAGKKLRQNDIKSDANFYRTYFILILAVLSVLGIKLLG